MKVMKKIMDKIKYLDVMNYYKYLKIFAIMQREANRVVRELWNLVKGALDDISPNHEKEDDKGYEENYGQNQIHENVENLENQEHAEYTEGNAENNEENKKEEQAKKDHVQAMKVLKDDNESKSNKHQEQQKEQSKN